MKIGKYNITNKQLGLGAVVLVVLIGLFFVIQQNTGARKMKSDLNKINSRINSGRASASELVDLNTRKKAILNNI